jgi:hypothetical protein
MVRVMELSVTVQSDIMLSVGDVECHYAKCHSVTVLNFVIQSVILRIIILCYNAKYIMMHVIMQRIVKPRVLILIALY